jgi:hypothetical protein
MLIAERSKQRGRLLRRPQSKSRSLEKYRYQQRTQRQQRPGQALIQPGAQPQAPVKPLQAASWIGVAF